MAKLGISTGSAPNDGTGDSLLDGAIKVNSNFNEIYTAIGDGTTLAVPVTNVVGGTGINVSGSTGSVTITNTGIANTNNLRTDFLEVSGISTLSGGLTVDGVSTFTDNVILNANLDLQDADKILLGTGDDLEIYHTGFHSFIVDSGVGDLYIRASSGYIQDQGNANQSWLKFNSAAGVEAHFAGNKKLETTTNGVTVTGALTATSFVGGGANITGISTLNIVNYSGGGGGSGIGNTNNIRTNFLEVSGISTFNGNVDVNAHVSFKAGSGNSQLYMYDENGINLGTNNDARIIYNNSGNIVKFERVGSAGEIEIDAAPVTLKHSDSIRLQTTAYGISVDQSIAGYAYLQAPFWKQPNGSMVTINVTVATKTQEHRYNGSGSGNGYLLNGVQAPFLTLTPGRSYRFLHTNTGSHPLKFYLEADRTTLYSTGVTFNNAYTEIAISDTTPQVLHYQCTNHAYMGNAVYTNSNKLQTPYTVSVGSGSSTNGIDSPALTLSHNNPTVVGTAGTTGQVKQIGGQPYYYDGTTWRALFLVDAPSTVNQADSDWDNTMIRMNFDQANIGAVTNLKDGRTPSAGQVDVVASPVKYGTKSARFQTNNSGLTFQQDNSGSVYYPFEGAWTLEGWFYFDSTQLPTAQSITDSGVLFANYHPSISVAANWKIGYYDLGGGTNVFNFYWHNRSSSNTGTNGAGNATTGFALKQIGKTTLSDNAWHHIAIVREPSNGSIHFYFDGSEANNTSSDQLIDNQINDVAGHGFRIGRYSYGGDVGNFEGNVDDIRVSKSARYTSNFTPPASALPITGSTTTVYEPADSKVGEISLGSSPAWTGTPGVTASQIAAGQYRATFATAYSNATDYVIQTSMNDYTPTTTPVSIGVSRFTTHADFFVRRVSDGANIDTGSLAIDLFKK